MSGYSVGGRRGGKSWLMASEVAEFDRKEVRVRERDQLRRQLVWCRKARHALDKHWWRARQVMRTDPATGAASVVMRLVCPHSRVLLEWPAVPEKSRAEVLADLDATHTRLRARYRAALGLGVKP